MREQYLLGQTEGNYEIVEVHLKKFHIPRVMQFALQIQTNS